MRDYFYRVITDQQGGLLAGMLKIFLLVLSFFYRGIVAARNYFYGHGIFPVVDLGKTVMSVGNITWGGVGKTPFVIYIAGYLCGRGIAPGILTRGYRKDPVGQFTGSDEAAMIRQYIPDVPVGVGADRVQTSRKILAAHAVDVFLLDDGFQHRQVRRDLDIVLVDSTNPFGHGRLIPAGILREPLNALKRCQIIVLTKSDAHPSATQALEERIRRINPSCVIAWAVHAPQALSELVSDRQEPLAHLRDRKIVSFCSIGDPRSFEESLQTIGAAVAKSFVFYDHYLYSAKDIEMIMDQAQKLGVNDFVTTAKDAVKILQFKNLFGARPCWVFKIEIELRKGKDKVFERIDHLLGR